MERNACHVYTYKQKFKMNSRKYAVKTFAQSLSASAGFHWDGELLRQHRGSGALRPFRKGGDAYM